MQNREQIQNPAQRRVIRRAVLFSYQIEAHDEVRELLAQLHGAQQIVEKVFRASHVRHDHPAVKAGMCGLHPITNGDDFSEDLGVNSWTTGTRSEEHTS